MPDSPFNETYFMDGKKAGVSLYENYTWRADLTIPMARAMIRHLGISPMDTILDFGCARGYTVKAFRQMDYRAFGIDISEWAVANADPEIKGMCWLSDKVSSPYDWILAKDVLEHVPQVTECIINLQYNAIKGIFAVVPLGSENNNQYVVPEYELDVTHLHRFALDEWVARFLRPGWAVTAQFRVEGVKDNYAHFERGNGFITARRL
jgi:hypothetical protein